MRQYDVIGNFTHVSQAGLCRQVVVQVVNVAYIGSVEHVGLAPVPVCVQVHLVCRKAEIRLEVDISLRAGEKFNLHAEMPLRISLPSRE